jgi:hypothetical protein
MRTDFAGIIWRLRGAARLAAAQMRRNEDWSVAQQLLGTRETGTLFELMAAHIMYEAAQQRSEPQA